MAENALTRTARALDLVPYVIENPGISIEDLAKEFDTTSEQMIKDLEMIFYLEENEYMGRITPQLVIRDFK